MQRRALRLIGVAFSCTLALASLAASEHVANLFQFGDPTGAMATLRTHGALDASNPFFLSLGTNGRTCATCHIVGQALSLSAAEAQARFAATHGADPLFAGVDGANCPGASPADADAHSLLLRNGLIRIALPVPSGAEFTIQAAYDPYGCADITDPATGVQTVSTYRRPLPATNLRFLSAVMFDGRDTVAPLDNPATFTENLETDLREQALDATMGHAQAAQPPSEQQLAAIVDFELSLYSAQSSDADAGPLQAHQASGGPVALAHQDYYPGINDSLGGNPTGAAFDPQVFSLFAAWADQPGAADRGRSPGQAAVAAGEAIFNSFPLTITNVGGLNDALGQETIVGTCTTCHDAPNVGDHSLPVPLDIGVSHSTSFESDPFIGAALTKLSQADLPIFKVTCAANPDRPIYTTDPGRALISGRCADLTRGKGPILRGLAARAPYFHNGAAATLREVVDFYDLRFQMKLSDGQKDQLVAFLQAL